MKEEFEGFSGPVCKLCGWELKNNKCTNISCERHGVDVSKISEIQKEEPVSIIKDKDVRKRATEIMAILEEQRISEDTDKEKDLSPPLPVKQKPEPEKEHSPKLTTAIDSINNTIREALMPDTVKEISKQLGTHDPNVWLNRKLPTIFKKAMEDHQICTVGEQWEVLKKISAPPVFQGIVDKFRDDWQRKMQGVVWF